MKLAYPYHDKASSLKRSNFEYRAIDSKRYRGSRPFNEPEEEEIR